MKLVGYSLADMLPAYPDRSEVYLDELLRDSANALSRPVISYGLLGIHPCRSRFFNISERGFRANGRQQPWPPEKDKKNIFFFGGSTTVGFNVEDSQTIPACLQRRLELSGAQCEVYNFGSGNYTSRHESLRFLDLMDHGFVPEYAVFLDGYNDSYYAFGNRDLVDTLDLLYQLEKKRRRSSYPRSLLEFAITSCKARRNSMPTILSYSCGTDREKLEKYLSESAITSALKASNRQLLSDEIDEFQVGICQSVWQRYLDSVAIIRALAGRKGVKTWFAWQPVPYYSTTKEQRVMERLYTVFRYGVFSSIVYNWLHVAGFPSLENDVQFVDLSALGRSLERVLYVDICHYSSFFCEVIAEAISDKLLPVLLST